MVFERNIATGAQDTFLRGLQHFMAECGMRLHDFLFFGCVLARLVEDVIGNADLADVVQR